MFQQICYAKAPPVHYGCDGSRSLSHAGAVQLWMSHTGKSHYWWVPFEPRCCLFQVSACYYAQRHKLILFLDVCAVCQDVDASEYFFDTNAVSPAHQMLFFFLLCLPLSIDFWKTSGSNLISSSKYRSS